MFGLPAPNRPMNSENVSPFAQPGRQGPRPWSGPWSESPPAAGWDGNSENYCPLSALKGAAGTLRARLRGALLACPGTATIFREYLPPRGQDPVPNLATNPGGPGQTGRGH